MPGGCLVYPMQLMNAANKAELLAWIKSWKVTSGLGNIKANAQATGGVMQEAWAYYNGRIGLSGVDYATTRPPTACSKYIIFIGNSFGFGRHAGRPEQQLRAAECPRRHEFHGPHECFPGCDAR